MFRARRRWAGLCFLGLIAFYFYANRKYEAIDIAVPLRSVQVAEILSQVRPPLYLLGGDDMTARLSKPAPGIVDWSILDPKGFESLTFRAAIAETENQSSRVVLSLRPPAYGPWQDLAISWIREKPAIARLYLAAMQEAIQSKFEARAFNARRTDAARAEAMFASLPELPAKIAGIKAASESADRNQRQAAEDNMAKAYSKEGVDHWR